jgi:hypothetical protein
MMGIGLGELVIVSLVCAVVLLPIVAMGAVLLVRRRRDGSR